MELHQSKNLSDSKGNNRQHKKINKISYSGLIFKLHKECKPLTNKTIAVFRK